MTLYYEDVPADDNDVPQLPPLLTAVAVLQTRMCMQRQLRLPHHQKLGRYSILNQRI